jgi:hypothetical protein
MTSLTVERWPRQRRCLVVDVFVKKKRNEGDLRARFMV